MSRKFTKTIEDFTCEHCKFFVKGNGFTNHCSKCLWSKHVDINPGDRLSSCGGLMEPFKIEKEGEVFRVIHKCLKCGFMKPNNVSPEDDFDILAKIAEDAAKKTLL